MNTQYRKNLKAVLEASKSYCDKRIDDLEWQIGTYNYDVATDSNVARIKTLPSDTYKSQINYIGGKSVKYNQLVLDTFRNYSYSLNQWNNASITDINIVENHMYLLVYKVSSFTSGNLKICFGNLASQPNAFTKTIDENTTLNTEISSVFTANSTIAGYKVNLYNLIADVAAGTFAYINLIDLTSIFGAGNEPSTIETAIPLLKSNGYKLDGTDEYSTGSLKHAIVSGVKYDGNYCNVNDSVIYATQTFQIASNLPAGTYTFKIIDFNDTNTSYAYNIRIGTTILDTKRCDQPSTFTTTEVENIFIYVNTSNALGYKIMLVKGSTAPSTYIPYAQPKLLPIPSEVLALDGYGIGYDGTCNNYIDFNSKKFVKMYHRYTFTGNESWAYNSTAQRWQTSITVDNSLIPPTSNTTKARLSVNVKVSIISNTYQRAGWEVFGTTGKLNFYINDNDELPSTTNPNTLFVSGKTLDYELATPVETDISQYLTTDFKVDLNNQYATCEMVVAEPIDMPNSITNLIKEVKA